MHTHYQLTQAVRAEWDDNEFRELRVINVIQWQLMTNVLMMRSLLCLEEEN